MHFRCKTVVEDMLSIEQHYQLEVGILIVPSDWYCIFYLLNNGNLQDRRGALIRNSNL